MMNSVKVDKWVKAVTPDVKISKEEVDTYLLRGPFKDALNFLSTNCRSLEEIDVLRSNLYVHGLSEGIPTSVSSTESRRVKELTKELAKKEEEKKAVMDAVIEEATEISHQSQHECVAQNDFQTFCAMSRELQDLHEMIDYVEGITENLTPLVETEQAIILERDGAYGGRLNEVQEEAIQLFLHTFLEDEDTGRAHELSDKLELLCESIVHGRTLRQKEVVVWQKSDIQTTRKIIKQLKEDNGNERVGKTEDEERLARVKDLKMKLMLKHISLNRKNAKLEEAIQSTKNERLEKEVELLGDPGAMGGVSKTHLLKMVHEEQLKAQMKSVNETKRKCTRHRASINNDPMGVMVGGDGATGLVTGCSKYNPENAERLICGLLKTYPDTTSKLLSLTQNNQSSTILESLKGIPPQNHSVGRTTTSKYDNSGWHESSGLDMTHVADSLLAVNPNSENVSASFALHYNYNSRSGHHSTSQLPSLSDRRGQSALDKVDQLISKKL